MKALEEMRKRIKPNGSIFSTNKQDGRLWEHIINKKETCRHYKSGGFCDLLGDLEDECEGVCPCYDDEDEYVEQGEKDEK